MAVRYPKLRSQGILSREIDDELLVHDATTNQTYCLDRTAAATLMACDGRTPVAGLLARLRAVAGDDFPEDALWVALEELRQRNLLEPESLPPTKFDGLSRRLMLQRLGTAAAIAPVILGVAATPALAQSATNCGCATAAGLDARDQGCPCASNNDCCGVCTGGVCSAVTLVGLPGAAQCCDVDSQCAAFASSDTINFCAFPAGFNGRRAGCACATNDDCCGVCSGGTCLAMTQASEGTAHGCCFFD